MTDTTFSLHLSSPSESTSLSVKKDTTKRPVRWIVDMTKTEFRYFVLYVAYEAKKMAREMHTPSKKISAKKRPFPPAKILGSLPRRAGMHTEVILDFSLRRVALHHTLAHTIREFAHSSPDEFKKDTKPVEIQAKARWIPEKKISPEQTSYEKERRCDKRKYDEIM